MRTYGFTLLELIMVLAVLTILLTVGVPQLSQQVQDTRTRAFTFDFMAAVQQARAQAVTRGERVTLRALDDWAKGWEIFADTNHNGIRDSGEVQLLQHRLTGDSIRVYSKEPVADNVSFIASGESRKTTGTLGGAWQGGTLKICPKEKGKAYQLVLRRGGRMRMAEILVSACGT